MDTTNGSLPDDRIPASLGPSEGDATSPDAIEMPAIRWDGRGHSESTMDALFPRLNPEYDLLPTVRDRGTRRARQLSQAASTVA
jgi:hypothetical protein